jgi:hypothetical protein
MGRNITLVGCLIAIGVAGCASTTRYAVKDVQLGMSTDEVLALVGEPVAQAEQHPYQAWRYEYRVTVSYDCLLGGGESAPGGPCRQVCEHTTVWFNNNEVRSMTSVGVDSLEECGTDSTPIIWEHMPDYVKAPDG